MTTLRTGLIQTRTPASPEAAFEHVAPLVRSAAHQGAELIVTPEGTNLLERNREKRALVLCTEDSDPCVFGLRNQARELGVWILIGSAIVDSGADGDARAANRSLLISPEGEVVSRYDKLHVFDVDLPGGESHRESLAIRPGEKAVLASTPWGGLGMSICYDVRFPGLYRSLARAGASMISVPAAFTVPTGRAHWEVLLRARAIETGCFILAPAQGGDHQDGRSTWGHSIVIGPWGEILGQIETDEPGFLLTELDLDLVSRARTAIPQLVHERAFAPPGVQA